MVGHLLLCGCEAVNRIDSNTGPLQLRLATDSASPVNVPDGYTADSEADLVTKLPGYDASKNIDLDFGLYAGYMTIDQDAGRSLYYTFAESKSQSSKHPLVLWLNGGPGCSSIGGGFLSELGPFYPDKHKGLSSNPHSWNKDANVIFVDSPANVGFSHSDDPADLAVGDFRVTADLVQFLKLFLKRFPAYENRPFWVSGESYGGHYVPNLAASILDRKHETGLRQLNLQGFLVGNAWTDPAIDNAGTIDFWWYHGLIGDQTYAALSKCNMSEVGPLASTDAKPSSNSLHSASQAAECQAVIDRVPLDMGSLNIYNIYADTCQPSYAAGLVARLAALTAGSASSVAASAATRNPKSSLRGKYDPCIDNKVGEYLNRRDVQHALHVPTADRPFPHYTVCSDQLRYNRSDVFVSMLPTYRKLLKSDLKMLVFSGDIDGIVPLVGTRRWINSLGLDMKEPWRPYTSTTGQTAGRVVVYDGLTFATVRAAGHMVPYVQPERAAYLFRNWIHGRRL